MRNELFYFDSSCLDRSLTNLCSSASFGKIGEKQKFFLLPDRRMSFLKILELPSVPGNKLRNIIHFQILKIYPGKTEDVSFDFIPFKTDTGWKIVLYILKKKYLDEVMDDKRFGGIVFPLQLLSKKEIKNISTFVIFYPDIVEKWRFLDGVPDGVEIHDPGVFSVQNLLIQEDGIYNPEKFIAIYPYSEIPKWNFKNGRTKKFSETLDSIPRNAIYFPEYRVEKKDRLTFPFVFTAFIISLLLLSLTVIKHKEFIRNKEDISAWIESVQLKTDQNRSALELIKKLESELTETKETTIINVYNLLLRIRKAVNSMTVVLSFVLKSEEFSLTLNSKNALNDLEGIKAEFGNVRASNIRTMDDGFENYTVWVKTGPWR